MQKIVVATSVAILGLLTACSDKKERYELIANSQQVQTWFDSKTGRSITCPLMSSDASCVTYGPFEERVETIRRDNLKEAAERKARENAALLENRGLHLDTSSSEVFDLESKEGSERLR